MNRFGVGRCCGCGGNPATLCYVHEAGTEILSRPFPNSFPAEITLNRNTFDPDAGFFYRIADISQTVPGTVITATDRDEHEGGPPNYDSILNTNIQIVPCDCILPDQRVHYDFAFGATTVTAQPGETVFITTDDPNAPPIVAVDVFPAATDRVEHSNSEFEASNSQDTVSASSSFIFPTGSSANLDFGPQAVAEAVDRSGGDFRVRVIAGPREQTLNHDPLDSPSNASASTSATYTFFHDGDRWLTHVVHQSDASIEVGGVTVSASYSVDVVRELIREIVFLDDAQENFMLVPNYQGAATIHAGNHVFPSPCNNTTPINTALRYNPEDEPVRIDVGEEIAANPIFPRNDGDGYSNYEAVSGTLPPGITIDPTTGEISGTPTEGAAVDFWVVATNSNTGRNAYGSFTLVVSDPNANAEFDYGGVLSGEVGQLQNFNPVIPAALGDASEFEDFRAIDGDPVPGLTLDNQTGQLSGTPTEVGFYTLDVVANRITDGLLITGEILIEIFQSDPNNPRNEDPATRDFYWVFEDLETITVCSGFNQGRSFLAQSDLDLTQYTNFRITQGGGNGVTIDASTGEITLQRTTEGEFFNRIELQADHVSNGTTIESFFFARFVYCPNGDDGTLNGEVPNDGPGCCFESESTEAISFSQGNGSNTVDGSSNSINDAAGVSNASFTTTLPDRAISQGSDGTYNLTVDYSYQSADNPDRSYAQISATLLGQTFFLTEQPISGTVSFDFDFPNTTECNISVGVEFLDVFEFTPGEETPLANHAYNYERIASQEACDSSGAEGGL